MADHLIDTPTGMRPGEELDAAALSGFLSATIGGNGPLALAQFPRGYSNLTYLLRWGERELVLRRPPFGAQIKSAHDMGREYRILSALHPVYPKAPRPLAYTEDPSILGAPFYVMERVRGLILRTTPPPGLDLSPTLMGRMCHSLVQTLAELHSLDYTAAGLAELGRPSGYVARQVQGWTTRYRNAQTDALPELDAALAWLATHRPPERGAALIHNDYKYDNLIYDPDEPARVVAVLDWEMATIGDPLMDVGTTLGYWAEPGDPEALQAFGLTTRPGNLNREEFAASYANASGRDVADILFYYTFGLAKVAVIMQQIYARYRAGHTADARFAGLIELVRACGDMAARAIERDRISKLYER